MQRQGSCGHDVLAGTWTDPYTGARLVFDDLKDLVVRVSGRRDAAVRLGTAPQGGGALARLTAGMRA